jgi:hypothetical protein
MFKPNKLPIHLEEFRKKGEEGCGARAGGRGGGGGGGSVGESADKKCRRSFQRHEHRAGRGLAGFGRARATTEPHDAAEAQAGGVCSDTDSGSEESGDGVRWRVVRR